MNCKFVKPLKKNINYYPGPPQPIHSKSTYCGLPSSAVAPPPPPPPVTTNGIYKRYNDKNVCRMPSKRPDSFAGFESFPPNIMSSINHAPDDYKEPLYSSKKANALQKSSSILNIPLLIELNNRNAKMQKCYPNKPLNDEYIKLCSKSSHKIPNLFTSHNDKSMSSHFQESAKPTYDYIVREGANYPIRPVPQCKLSNPIVTRTSSRQFTNSTILKERCDLNKSVDKINFKLKNMRILSERGNNNVEPKIYCSKPALIAKKSNSNISTNLNEFKCRFIRREQPQVNPKIPVIIEDIKSLDIVVNEQQNSNSNCDVNEKKIETKIVAKLRRENVPLANGEQVKKAPVFIRPNVEKLLQPTIRGAPKEILLKNNIFESNETSINNNAKKLDTPTINNSKDTTTATTTTTTNNNKNKTKFSHLNFFKKKFLSSGSFISKLSDKTSESSVSNLNCFDTDTDNDNHSSTTTSVSSKSQSINSLTSHELELFRVQSEKNFFNENHFTNQNKAQIDDSPVEQMNRRNTLNKYMIRSKSLSSDEDGDEDGEDENEDDNDISSDSSSDACEQNIVPCCRIKLDTNDQNVIKINTNSINKSSTDTHNNSNNKIMNTNNNLNLNSNTTSITTNNNIDNPINNDKTNKKTQSITIVEKKPETKFRITLRKNSDNLDIITINEIRSNPMSVAKKVTKEAEPISKLNERSITSSIIDVPLPNEKDSFSEYSLFVDKIFKNVLSSN